MLVMWSSKGEKFYMTKWKVFKAYASRKRECVHMTIEAASGNNEIQKC